MRFILLPDGDLVIVQQTSKPPLRVGLLINSYSQPAWCYKVIKDIKSSGVADEVKISEVTPHWRRKLLGTNTLNRCEGLTVTDGLLSRWRIL